MLTTVPRNRALKRHKPFADLPPQVAEAFRMLQMNLRFAREEPVRSVLVTSARTGEGKTTVAWNLAAAAAPAGSRSRWWRPTCAGPSLAERYGLEQRARAGGGAAGRGLDLRRDAADPADPAAARTRSDTRARCT